MKKTSLMKLKTLQKIPYSKYFMVYLALVWILRPQKIELLSEMFRKFHSIPRK